MVELGGLPGAQQVEQGLADLAAGLMSVPALLVAISSTRLSRLGLAVPAVPWREPELRLYRLLCAQDAQGAYATYNSLLRRIDSFARALEREEGAALRAARAREQLGGADEV